MLGVLPCEPSVVAREPGSSPLAVRSPGTQGHEGRPGPIGSPRSGRSAPSAAAPPKCAETTQQFAPSPRPARADPRRAPTAPAPCRRCRSGRSSCPAYRPGARVPSGSTTGARYERRGAGGGFSPPSDVVERSAPSRLPGRSATVATATAGWDAPTGPVKDPGGRTGASRSFR